MKDVIMALADIKPKLVDKIRTLVARTVDEKVYESLLLQGRMASWQVRSMKTIESLHDAGFKVFSQFDEDGIIDWMIERAAIPASLHTFVEFGVQTYVEANTRFLIENRNWRGLVMDGDPTLGDVLKKDHRNYRFDLRSKSAFITRENINDLLVQAGFAGEIGLLSIDVDGNDYWIWEALEVARPVIFVTEYNAVFGDLHPVSIPYDPEFQVGQTQKNRLYFGASIAALSALGATKGYKLLGTTLVGNDAFFIREDYASRFDDALKHVVAMASKFRMQTDPANQLPWIEGYERCESISDLPLINTVTGAKVTLGELGPIYSDGWLQQIGK